MKKEKVDLIVSDAVIYTADNEFSIVEAFAVKDGKFYDRGTSKDILGKYEANTVISLKGSYVYPGWNDAHCHFVGYGLSLNQVDLAGTRSMEECLERCRDFAKSNSSAWIIGRGWDQNDWKDKVYPSREDLDDLFPDRPVFLKRIDGHAAWVNSKALELAGIDAGTSVSGGEIKLKNGRPSGILIDNGVDIVDKAIAAPSSEDYSKALLAAQKNCFGVGLTSLSDAGLETNVIQLIESMQEDGRLKMRINAWLSPTESNFETYMKNGVLKTDHLSVGTLKLYADGALGSRGARMIEDYSDDPGNKGLFLTDLSRIKEYCQLALENNYQVATHCIGDDANRQILKIYSSLLDEGNDKRWRIEHAQIIHPDDFPLFGKYNIVASVQPTHATSDMYWAIDRIGAERMSGAYSYKTLLDQLGWIPNGSDFPVEDINPLYGFYAAVARKDRAGFPEQGFRMEEALNREEALRAMTIWPAKAAFEEDFKGSIEIGKVADFVVCGEDIMKVEERRIPEIKVNKTFSGGEQVYER